MSTFNTFSIPSDSCFVGASTREYSLPTHAKIPTQSNTVSFEKGKCYEIKADGCLYQIRYIGTVDENKIRGEFWNRGIYAGVGAFLRPQLVREIPQIQTKMIRGGRYVAKLKGDYAVQTWLFDFGSQNGGQIYYLTFCNDLEGWVKYGQDCLVNWKDVDFIVPEEIWKQHYAK